MLFHFKVWHSSNQYSIIRRHIVILPQNSTIGGGGTCGERQLWWMAAVDKKLVVKRHPLTKKIVVRRTCGESAATAMVKGSCGERQSWWKELVVERSCGEWRPSTKTCGEKSPADKEKCGVTDLWWIGSHRLQCHGLSLPGEFIPLYSMNLICPEGCVS